MQTLFIIQNVREQWETFLSTYTFILGMRVNKHIYHSCLYSVTCQWTIIKSWQVIPEVCRFLTES